MDQDAFRALVSTPRNGGGSSSSASSSKLWGATPRRGAALGGSSKTDADDGAFKKPAFKPRAFKGKNKDSEDGDGEGKKRAKLPEGYRDRASERRGGQEGDFAEAEKMLETFQARAAAAGEQLPKELLEQQMAYLGGDASHTILVKGLDMALLQRRRAELAAGGLPEATDDDLEAALAASMNDDDPTAPLPATKHRKRTRDDLLAELDTKRGASTVSSSEALPASTVTAKDDLKAAGKFKPIGAKEKTAEQKADEEKRKQKRRKKERRELRAKKEAEDAERVQFEEAQRMAEERKQSARSFSSGPMDDVTPSSEPPTTLASQDPAPIPIQSSVPEVAALPVLPAAQDAPAPLVPDNNDDNDDDDDIFADTGDYKGFGSDEDEEEEKETAPKPAVDEQAPAVVPIVVRGRRNWFGAEDDAVDAQGPAEAEKDQEATAATANDKPETSTSGPSHKASCTLDEDPESEPPNATRLSGLSGSSDIRALLALDAAAEKAEKKKNKKLKVKKEMTDKDKLNRDYQQMTNFLEKKKGKDEPTGASK